LLNSRVDKFSLASSRVNGGYFNWINVCIKFVCVMIKTVGEERGKVLKRKKAKNTTPFLLPQTRLSPFARNIIIASYAPAPNDPISNLPPKAAMVQTFGSQGDDLKSKTHNEKE